MKNVHSETILNSEANTLDKIYETISKEIKHANPRWCVEFGAGRKNSNTWDLVNQKGWHAVLIEAHPVFFRDLEKLYAGNTRVTCINRRVSFEGKDVLDGIFSETHLPKNFDLLVIDIDGNDIHVWESLSAYRPKIVMIEYNGRIPIDIDFAQPKDSHLNWGSSLPALVRVGKEKGYELVYAHICNAIFVRKELFPLFSIADNSPERIEKPFWPEGRWFQLHDGTIVLHGVERKKLLSFKKKITREPLYLLTPEGLSLVTFRRDGKAVRFLKNFIRKTPLYGVLYPFVSRIYTHAWRRKKASL